MMKDQDDIQLFIRAPGFIISAEERREILKSRLLKELKDPDKTAEQKSYILCQPWGSPEAEILTPQLLRKFMIACVVNLDPYGPNPNVIWESYQWEQASEREIQAYHYHAIKNFFEFADVAGGWTDRQLLEWELVLLASAEAPEACCVRVSSLHHMISESYNEGNVAGAPYRGYEWQVEELIRLIEQETK